MTNDRLNMMAYLLTCLERELRSLNWWSSASPSEEKLSSLAPFCVDTLSLEEWLQWVFIPKTKNYIKIYNDLPQKCGIVPLAEEVWRERSSTDIAPLMQVLQRIDDVIEQGRAGDLVMIEEHQL